MCARRGGTAKETGLRGDLLLGLLLEAASTRWELPGLTADLGPAPPPRRFPTFCVWFFLTAFISTSEKVHSVVPTINFMTARGYLWRNFEWIWFGFIFAEVAIDSPSELVRPPLLNETSPSCFTLFLNILVVAKLIDIGFICLFWHEYVFARGLKLKIILSCLSFCLSTLWVLLFWDCVNTTPISILPFSSRHMMCTVSRLLFFGRNRAIILIIMVLDDVVTASSSLLAYHWDTSSHCLVVIGWLIFGANTDYTHWASLVIC